MGPLGRWGLQVPTHSSSAMAGSVHGQEGDRVLGHPVVSYSWPSCSHSCFSCYSILQAQSLPNGDMGFSSSNK